jgi:hypothetical protein
MNNTLYINMIVRTRAANEVGSASVPFRIAPVRR